MESSPLSACSDNSDSAARVYFGPMLSPEKQQLPFLAASSPTITYPFTFVSNSSATRRSPRLSTSPLRPEHGEQSGMPESRAGEFEEEEEELSGAAGPSMPWNGTPLQNILRRDEPSSAIANRIVRAIDNPSPPPKALRMSITPRRTSRLANELKFPSIETDEEDEVDKSLDPQSSRLAAFSPTRDDLFRGPSPTPQITLNAPEDNAQDLISFDKTVVLSSPPNDERTIHSPSPRSLTVSMPSIDDLLCSSPLQADTNFVPTVEALLDLPERSSPIPRRRSPRLSALPPQRLLSPERARTPERSRSRSPTGKKRLRNGEDKCLSDWSAVDSESDSERSKSMSPSPGKRRGKKRVKTDVDEGANSKELRLGESLSPESAQILSTLMTPKVSPATPAPDVEMHDRLPSTTDWTATPLPESVSALIPRSPSPTPKPIPAPIHTQSIQRPPPGAIIHNPTTPVRGGLGAQTLLSNGSPVKLTLTPAPENPNRTPARRVAVFTAPDRTLSTNQQSLPSGSHALAPGVVFTPVFSRPPVDSPSRSPARRIPVTEAMSSDVHRTPRSPSFQIQRPPIPTQAHSRSVTPEPKRKEGDVIDLETEDTIVISRPKPSSSSIISEPSHHNSAVRYNVRPERPANATSSASAIVSLSKEPPSTSSQPGSKIPRMNGAPKATVLNRSSRLPMPSTRKIKTGPVPTRLPSPSKPMVKHVGPPQSGSSSGSDDQGSSSVPSKANVKPKAGVNVAASRLPPPAIGSVVVSAAHKRKKIEKTSPPRTMVKMRQVVPGMFGGPVKSTSNNVNGVTTKLLANNDKDSSSPAKPQPSKGLVKVREVVKGTLQDFELRNETSTRVEAALNEAAEARAREAEAKRAAEADAHSNLSDAIAPLCETTGQVMEDGAAASFPVPSGQLPDEVHMDVDHPAVHASNDSNSDPSSSSSSQPSSETPKVPLFTIGQPPPEFPAHPTGSRRSARTRKSVSRNDVFGPVSNLPSSVPQKTISRRAAISRGPASGVASKTATSPGPSSLIFTLDGPSGLALKTLTNSNTARNQQYHAQLEIENLIIRRPGNRPESPTMKLRTITEKMKEEQSKRRDERARRRRGDSDGDITMSEDGDVSLGADMSMDLPEIITNVDVPPLKHRRGPGEDEDYESPSRPEQNGAKRVKWDYGLHTEAYVDEIEFNLERRTGSVPNDGLVPKLKKIPLDSMGNLLDKDTPIELVPEKVVVTKYVYDNDELPPPTAPTPAPRATRSKSKGKGKQ